MALTTPRPKANYNCSQEELYQVCLLGWDSYIENVADFTAINTTYTLDYGQNQRAAVLSAKRLPDFQARDERSETLGIQMKEAADECLIHWKLLESHIKKSFPENLHKPKLEAAGANQYQKAGQGNWESVSALMESGNNFITDNNAALTTGGMPASFPATFETTKTSFENLFSQTKDAEQDSEEQRDTKVNANNGIFKKLSEMFEDGQKIYRNNPAKKERFMFTKVLELVSGAGVSTKKVTLPPQAEEIVDKVRANSPIINTAQTTIMVGAHDSTQLTPLLPEDTVANSFGPKIKLKNEDAQNTAKATVRVSQA